VAPPDPIELRDLALAVAVPIGRALRVTGDRVWQPDTKSSATDLVTEADRATEVALVEGLLAARPGDGVLGEEGAARASSTGVTWVIDPIDGTTNFVYGYPGFNVSVAAELDGEVVAGVVVDVLHDEVFAAARGKGATCNGAPIRCNEATDLAHALVATGFGYTADQRARQAQLLTTVLPAVRDIRRGGAAAVDLCWVGCGRVDGYYEEGLKQWDLAAGGLVAREAGATVAQCPVPDGGLAVTVAAPPGLFEALAGLVGALPLAEDA
jgi:myo-inositol-1(or 4)-monophosphatase